LHEETHKACHEGEFSEASEQFSDEDSDYGNCARVSALQFTTFTLQAREKASSEGDENFFGWGILCEKLQTEEESHPSPSHASAASGRLFRSKKEKEFLTTHAHR
jgi:hypothetical protein